MQPVLYGLLLLATAFAGCDSTSVDPFISTDRYFSIYGSLDMQLTTQFLRVEAIDTQFGADDPTVIDAVVRSIDLNSSETEIWRDSLITFSDDTHGHVFMSRLRVRAGHKYRIEVERSDGAVTWAETTVPAEPRAEVGAANVTSPPESPLPTGAQSVFWRGLTKEPHRVDVYYRYKSVPANPFLDIRVPYPTASTREDTSEGWEITVSYTRDRRMLSEEIGNVGLRLAGVAMQVIVLADDWVPPGGVWDPEVLSQPGALSNVHQGFGFVGSAGRFSVEWVL
jgi:hypothetical protein